MKGEKVVRPRGEERRRKEEGGRGGKSIPQLVNVLEKRKKEKKKEKKVQTARHSLVSRQTFSQKGEKEREGGRRK